MGRPKFGKAMSADREKRAREIADLEKRIRTPIKISGCRCCGSKLVFIRGRFPDEAEREICPTCTYERLEQIHEMTDPNRGIAQTEKGA